MRTLIAVTLSFLATDALACGQTTHVWVGLHAVDHLPEGELKSLLSRPEMVPYLVNGSMFPDGGYSPIVRDGYGETAHWEPFQTAWMDWIRTTYGPDFTNPEADGRIAFLFGLAAHGMADQVYDGIYLTRSLAYDGQEAWDTWGDVDKATDIAMASEVGAFPILDLEDVVPYDDLVRVFAAYGQPVEKNTLSNGQLSLRLAIQYVGAMGQSAEAETYKAQYPWATAHMTNPDIPGSPACISAAVAAYWETMWDRLHGDWSPDDRPIVYTWPHPDEADHPTSAADLESQIGAVLARATDLETLGPGAIVVTDEAGREHPVTWRLYYGDNTNVLNLWPTEDWADNTDYTVTLQPGATSFDGEVLAEPASFSFTTKPTREGCGGCATGSPQALGLAAALGLVAVRRRRR